MQIVLNKVGEPYMKNGYGKLDLEYTRDGKNSKTTLTAVGPTKGVVQSLKGAQAGETWDIKMEKKGEFWNWIDATKLEGAPAGDAPAPAARSFSPGTKWQGESPEERARKNISIARQNALTNAVNFVSAKDGKATIDQVIDVATQFAAFTLGELSVTGDAPAEEEAKPAAKPTTRKSKVGDAEFDDDLPF